MSRRGWGAHRANNPLLRSRRGADRVCGQAIDKLDACRCTKELATALAWLNDLDLSTASGEAKAAVRAAYGQAFSRVTGLDAPETPHICVP